MKEKLDFFTDKLLEWNKVHNLTGAKSKEEVEANIEDSLYPLRFLDQNIKKALDIGTGAGFPGLMLAIAMPQTHWVLAEPRQKRASFLRYIASSLDLDNVEVAPKRVEQIEPFAADLITSRAVTKTPLLLDLAKGFITPDTTLLLYKGAEVDKELKNLTNYRLESRGKRNYLIIKGEDIV